VEAVIFGRVDILQEYLQTKPELASQKSQFGHKASLLHYCGSNGVELIRQVVPLNLPFIIRVLLDFGADAKAQMNIYGGKFTPLQLLTTSLHPYNAGVMTTAVRALTY